MSSNTDAHAQLLAEIMDDWKDENAETGTYAAFGQLDPKDLTKVAPTDDTMDPAERQDTVAIITARVVVILALLFVASPWFGTVADFFNGSATATNTSHFEPTPPEGDTIDPQLLQELIDRATEAPATEQSSTASHLEPFGIPFDPRALPKLIELDPPTASDATTGHLEKLQPFGW